MSKNENKCINENSFVADINTLKVPLFLYSNFKQPTDSKGNKLQIEERTYKWTDSKNKTRELYMYCKGRLPRQFESDTLHGLMGLFVKKHAPFPYNEKKQQYDINVNKLEFSWYELCKYMNIPATGYYIEKLKDAIRILKQTQYISKENGSIYDKENSKYLISGETGMSLISKFKFKTSKKIAENDEYSTTIDSNEVFFDELILNNLRYEYFKYLDGKLFFEVIPSGIERGIYGYLEANRYDNNNKTLKYIKRSYETLKIGIPIDFNYPYEIKKRLKKPLNHLKKIGYIKDWIFGDDLKLDDKKENCVYFCFEIDVTELKNMLEKKILKAKQLKFKITDDVEDEQSNERLTYLKMPSGSLNEELVSRGLDRTFAANVVNKFDKFDIITLIIWSDKMLYEKKLKNKNMGGILGFAFRKENLDISAGNEEIIEFIKNEKDKLENDNVSKLEKIKCKYKEYINSEVQNFIISDEYEAIKELILSFQNSHIDQIITNNKKLGNDISKFENFKIEQEKSDYFKVLLEKEVKLYKNLLTEQEFIEKYYDKI